MTPIEAAIVTAYTTFLCGSFENFHKYAEEKLSRKIYTHEFVGANVWIELEKLSKGDFMNLKVDDVCEWSRESCEICDPALINPLIDEDGLYLFIDKDRIMTGYSDDCTFEKSESVKINYCPMCGREI